MEINRQTRIHEAENALKVSALLLSYVFFRTLIGFANTKWAIVVFMTQALTFYSEKKTFALTNPRINTLNFKIVREKNVYPLNNCNFTEE